MISVVFYKLGVFFARILPESVSRATTELILLAQYPFRFASKRNVMHNLGVVFPEWSPRERRRVRRRVLSNFAWSIESFLHVAAKGADAFNDRCDYNGIDRVIAELRQKGGVLLVSPHLGPWEVGGAALASLGLPMHTVALPHPSRQVTDFFQKQRRRAGIDSVSLGASVRPLIRALNSREVVALLVDRLYDVRTESFEWFGREREMPVGHLMLAVLTQTPVLPIVCVFDGRRGFKFYYTEARYARSDLEPADAIRELQRQCLEDLASFIRRFPDQWFHFEAL